MADILDFNSKKKQIEEQKDDELLHELEDVVTDVSQEIMEMLDAYGLTERDENYARDYFYLIEAVRSLVFGYHNIEHPFHSVIYDMVDVIQYEDEDDSTTYRVMWKEQETDEGTTLSVEGLDELIDWDEYEKITISVLDEEDDSR